MNLDRIIINLRERNHWEAMDLGARLVISLIDRMLLPWILLISIFLSLSIFIQLQGYSITGLLLVWLFKPVYDSLLLYIYSKELFSESVTSRHILFDTKQWLLPGIKHSLYWWRFSPMRSFVMPVHNLEHLTSNSRKQRIKILQKDTSSHAIGLTVLAINFEILVNLSLYAVLAFMLSDEVASFIWNYLEGDDSTAGLIMNTLLYGVAILIIEPLYLAAGFMLYLNRRIKLEAWDIEIAFKRIDNRLSRTHLNAVI